MNQSLLDILYQCCHISSFLTSFIITLLSRLFDYKLHSNVQGNVKGGHQQRPRCRMRTDTWKCKTIRLVIHFSILGCYSYWTNSLEPMAIESGVMCVFIHNKVQVSLYCSLDPPLHRSLWQELLHNRFQHILEFNLGLILTWQLCEMPIEQKGLICMF